MRGNIWCLFIFWVWVWKQGFICNEGLLGKTSEHVCGRVILIILTEVERHSQCRQHHSVGRRFWIAWMEKLLSLLSGDVIWPTASSFCSLDFASMMVYRVPEFLHILFFKVWHFVWLSNLFPCLIFQICSPLFNLLVWLSIDFLFKFLNFLSHFISFLFFFRYFISIKILFLHLEVFLLFHSGFFVLFLSS